MEMSSTNKKKTFLVLSICIHTRMNEDRNVNKTKMVHTSTNEGKNQNRL